MNETSELWLILIPGFILLWASIGFWRLKSVERAAEEKAKTPTVRARVWQDSAGWHWIAEYTHYGHYWGQLGKGDALSRTKALMLAKSAADDWRAKNNAEVVDV